MADLFDTINALIASPADLPTIERTLTDGYAHALALEGASRRIERRISEITRGLGGGDATTQVDELAALSRRLDATTADLGRLREVLATLRRVADGVRLGSAESAA